MNQVCRIALVLLACAATAQADPSRLSARAVFEVTGTDATRGAYRGVVTVEPAAGGLTATRALTYADGSEETHTAAATQEAYRVEASFAPARGLAGHLGGAAAGPPLTWALEHDGAGRCRTQAWREGARVAAARGQAPGVETTLDVAILSDLNGEAGSPDYGRPTRAAVSAVRDRFRPDVVLITGDMVAGQLSGWKDAANHARLRRTVRRMWSGFHAAVTRPLTGAGIPVAPAPGNHDASVWRPHERRLYAAAWADADAWAGAPVQVVDGSDYPFRYSFVLGGVFFLALDATRAGRLEHQAWVAEQLGSPLAQACPARIVYGHVPLHPTAERRRTAILHRSVEALFAAHDVSLYVAGHHHAYYPGAAGGVRQVVMACLGGGRRPLIGEQARSPHSLVRVQIRGGAVTAVEGFRGADYTQRVERADLPRRIGVLERDDRAGFGSTWEDGAP